MASANVAKHQRRMKRMIGALLATLAPLAVAEACGTTSTGTAADAGKDATLDQTADTSVAEDVGTDATSDTGIDALPPNCQSTVIVNDSGFDAATDSPADPTCSYQLSCGISGQLRTSGCQVLSVMDIDAEPQPLGCWVVADGCDQDVYVPDANVTVQCSDCIGGGGRRPEELRKAGPRVSGYLAAMAYEERAAVLAFLRMEAELRHHDAPMSLRKAARRATADERRHARVLGALARKAGASVSRARVAKKPTRSLLEIALENATEGCIRETFGAALLAYQAAHATDTAMRDAFTAIAEDESRHAALSWALASWAESQLNADEAAEVRAARSDALKSLREEIAHRRAGANDAEIGHPSREIATALLEGVARELSLG